MKTKYVITESYGTAKVSLIPPWGSHTDICPLFPETKVVGAGYFEFYVDENGEVNLTCFGESVSLVGQPKSRKEDVALLQQFFRLKSYNS